MRVIGLFLFFITLQAFSTTSGCGLKLHEEGEESWQKVVPPDVSDDWELHELEMMASNELFPRRSNTNNTSKYEEENPNNNFLEAIDAEKLLSMQATHKRRPDRSYERDLAYDFSSIQAGLKNPIIDPKEIRARQEVQKELLGNSELKEKLETWSEENDNLRISNRSRLGDLIRGDIPYIYANSHFLDQDRANARGTLTFMTELPKAMLTATQSLEGAKSKRLQHLSALAHTVAHDANLQSALAKIKEKTAKGLDKMSDDELNDALKIVSQLSDETKVLQNIQFIGEQLTATNALSNFAAQKGWTTFPQILDRNMKQGPILNIENGHDPRVLAEKGMGSVANSINLGGDGPKTLLVTGPNEEGKTTSMRMASKIALLAQMGLPVPADKMQITPLSLYFHVNPPDAPSQNMSLFAKQVQDLYENTLTRVRKDPFQLVMLDEILPGTISKIRTAAEIVFLRKLKREGRNNLTIATLHNWGTTKLEDEDPAYFKNMHVDKYNLKDGAQENYQAMVDAAAVSLGRVLDSTELDEFRAECEKQNAGQ